MLYLLKNLFRDDRGMSVFKDHQVFFGALLPLLIPKGIGVGLEIDRAAEVFPAFQNDGYRRSVPVVRIGTGFFRVRAAHLFHVSGGRQNLPFCQLVGDLGWASTLHAHGEDFLYDLRRFVIHDPLFRIFGVFHVAIGTVDAEVLPALSLCPLDRPHLPAGIPGIKLVKPVFHARHIIVDAGLVNGIDGIVDGNEPDTVIREDEVLVQVRHGGVPAQPGKVFCDHYGHMARFDLCQHALEAWPIKADAAVTIVHKESGIGETVILCVPLQDVLLILDGQALAGSFVLLGQPAIEGSDFLIDP